MSTTTCEHCGQGHVCHIPLKSINAVLEDLALSLDAKSDVALTYGENEKHEAYVNAAALLRSKIS